MESLLAHLKGIDPVAVVAILLFGWLLDARLRSQIRTAVQEGVSGAASGLTTAINENTGRIKEHAETLARHAALIESTDARARKAHDRLDDLIRPKVTT